jgi:hypothetical protein
MKRAGLILFLFFLFPCEQVLAQPATCCFSCSCTTCGDLADCLAYQAIDPTNNIPSDVCNQYTENGPSQGCGIGATPCAEWYDNSVHTGTTVDSYSSTSGTNPCIPIDGGLGFLIAGGIGMGVVGIRRRKGELELKRA